MPTRRLYLTHTFQECEYAQQQSSSEWVVMVQSLSQNAALPNVQWSVQQQESRHAGGTDHHQKKGTWGPRKDGQAKAELTNPTCI